MLKPSKAATLLTVSLISLLSVGPLAGAQDEKSIAGRMEMETHDDYFKVRVFLTNETDHEITVETGHGHRGRSVTPHFSYGYMDLQATQWLGPGRRANQPDPLTLKAGVEILYDTYIIPTPRRAPWAEEDRFFEGYIHFGGLDKENLDKHTGAHYSVRLGSHKLPSPPPKPANSP